MQIHAFPRRAVLAGLAAAPVLAACPGRAAPLDPQSDADQSAALQAALDAAPGRLSLPAGHFRVSTLRLPSNLVVEGVPGATWLIAQGAAVATLSGAANVVLRDLGFVGDSGTDPLLGIAASTAISLERCLFRDNPGIGVGLSESAATIADCDFSGHGDAAIHAMDGKGLLVTGNRIARCGNAGIRVWRGESGEDGTILVNNRIAGIDWRGGGNGQNGNGINIFRADAVIVAGNHLENCAFSAIRLNATNNCQVSANQCLASGEVAIFSEFAFSGSIIANNLVDGAAAGISITNFDVGGHLAVCNGNIVRNVAPASRVNPDTSPVGIFAEADCAITGNVVENVPGPAIGAGWGPYLRNVLVADNVVTGSRIGIAVSLADGAGPVTLSGNSIDAEDHAIAGMLWTEIAEPDLLAAAGRYPHVQVK